MVTTAIQAYSRYNGKRAKNKKPSNCRGDNFSRLAYKRLLYDEQRQKEKEGNPGRRKNTCENIGTNRTTNSLL